MRISRAPVSTSSRAEELLRALEKAEGMRQKRRPWSVNTADRRGPRLFRYSSTPRRCSSARSRFRRPCSAIRQPCGRGANLPVARQLDERADVIGAERRNVGA